MKILFRIAVVLLVLAALAILGIGIFFDSLAKAAVEKGGTFAMGVETRVESVDIGFLSGKFELSELHIANPEGFQAEDFFALQTAKFELDTKSVGGDTLVIPLILIEGVTLEIEQTPDGANYQAILDNLQRFQTSEAKPTEESTEPAESGEGPKLVVRNITMRDVKAHVKLDVLGKQTDFTVPVPNFTIENVGNSDDSQSIADILSTILQETLDSVAENGGGLLPESMVADIKGQLTELEQAGDKLVEDLGADAKNIIDGTGNKDDLKKTAKDSLKGFLDKD